MRTPRVIVIGAGIGGLVAALELAAQGLEVTVLERAAHPGGKLRAAHIGGTMIDVGPTVFTLRRVFDAIFEAAGASLDDHVRLVPVEVLARHAWSEAERLDLYIDVERSADAVGVLAGPDEARRFIGFCEESKRVCATLVDSFMATAEPTPLSLVRAAGLAGLGDLWRIRPFETLWHALGRHFRDARLRQLFGRYATYCGSSPFACPATLMLIAEVERQGVWLVEGGMTRLVEALATLGALRGVHFRTGEAVAALSTAAGRIDGVVLEGGAEIRADAVVCNADVGALAAGCLGEPARRAIPSPPKARSLSAVTWALLARADGFPLLRHNVFFSRDYAAEFRALFDDGRMPAAPTVYVCAQDRDDRGSHDPGTASQAERLMCLINAPPCGERGAFDETEIAECQSRILGMLSRSGLSIHPSASAPAVTTPEDFARLFPGTGGALYGSATHGWRAAFARPTARSRLPGLYLTGGSTHPGPGVPMAALSGRFAAQRLLADLTSMRRSSRVAMPGGISMR